MLLCLGTSLYVSRYYQTVFIILDQLIFTARPRIYVSSSSPRTLRLLLWPSKRLRSRCKVKKSISRPRILQLLSECAIWDSKVYRNGHLVDYGQDGDTASRRPALELLRRRRRRIYFSADVPPLDFDGHSNGRALCADDKSWITRELISSFSLSPRHSFPITPDQPL